MKSNYLLSFLIMAAMTCASSIRAAELRVVGTGDGMDLLGAVAAAFTADNPEIVVQIPPSIGSGGGIAAVASDRAILARIARPLSATETSQGLIATPFVKLPSAFFVHPSVRIRSLTYEQLAGIYSGEFDNWRQVGGPDLRIKVVRREDADSTLSVIRQFMPGWKDLPLTAKSKTAVTTQEAIDITRTTEGAIGFGPYTMQLETGLIVLKIAEKHPTDQGYASAATLSIVHREATISADGRSFLKYVVSPKAKSLLTSLGGVPLTP